MHINIHYKMVGQQVVATLVTVLPKVGKQTQVMTYQGK